MKLMGRQFTRAEKILLVVLALILIALVYYKFVYTNIEQTISTANAEAETLQSELDIQQVQLASLQKMQNELDEIEADPNASRIESYNNSTAEIAFLNDILEDSIQYSITFGDVTRSGDTIRRNFTLQYQTKNYAAAQKITEALSDGSMRCLIGDMRCSTDEEGLVTVSETATFFETMVGGTPDSLLPEDPAAVAEAEQALTDQLAAAKEAAEAQ